MVLVQAYLNKQPIEDHVGLQDLQERMKPKFYLIYARFFLQHISTFRLLILNQQLKFE